MSSLPFTKSEKTRAAIIDAAYQLFLDQGFHATSLRQIVQKSGVTMGGIYNYFASKEEIWQAVLYDKHPFHEVMPVLEAASGETLAEIVRDTASRWVAEIGKRDRFLNLMFIEIVEFNSRNISQVFDLFYPQLSALLTKLYQKKGSMRPVSTVNLVRSFAGLFFSFYITSRFLPPALVVQQDEQSNLEEFVDIYLFGILAEDDPSRGEHD